MEQDEVYKDINYQRIGFFLERWGEGKKEGEQERGCLVFDFQVFGRVVSI